MDVLLAILAAWVIGGGAIIGVGLLLASGPGQQPREEPDYFTAFWVGLGASISVAQLWHLWLPINVAFALLIVLVGLAGIISWRAWRDFAWALSHYRFAVLAFAVAAVWFALMGLRPLEIYDAGLYHLQAVTWNTTYPTVPGLGNLHGRLAFYSSYFLLLAAFAQGPLATDYYRAVIGLLTLVFLAQVSMSVVRVARTGFGRERTSASDWLMTFMALPTLITIGGNGVSTTSTDVPLFPLEILIAYYVVRWIEKREAKSGARQLACALALIGVAASVKLSALGFALACLVLISAIQRARWVIQPPVAVGFAMMCVLLVGMLINSVMLSGYPIYPSTLFAMPVDWRVPETIALEDRAGIELFAHQPPKLTAVALQGWDWLPLWLEFNWANLLAPAIGCVAGLAALGVAWLHTRNKPGQPALLLMPVYAGLMLWFFTAPSVRFVGALLWLAAAIPLADLCARGSTRIARLSVGLFVVLAVLPGQAEPLSVVLRAPVASLRHGLSPVPTVPMKTFVTDSGVTLFVPEKADQAWASALPSTPTPDRRLRLRCPDSLACGFTLDESYRV